MAANLKIIKVIPPKAGENQCRVMPPTEFADKPGAIASGSDPDRIQWVNRTGSSMTVQVRQGIFGAAVAEPVPNGGSSQEYRIAETAPSGVSTYTILCDLTNGPARGNSDPEVVVEP